MLINLWDHSLYFRCSVRMQTIYHENASIVSVLFLHLPMEHFFTLQLIIWTETDWDTQTEVYKHVLWYYVSWCYFKFLSLFSCEPLKWPLKHAVHLLQSSEWVQNCNLCQPSWVHMHGRIEEKAREALAPPPRPPWLKKQTIFRRIDKLIFHWIDS